MSSLRIFFLGKYFAFSLFAVILSSAVFIACNKEDSVVSFDNNYKSVSKSNLSIQAATQWFDNYIKSSEISKNSRYKNLQPMWDKATANEEAIEVPFTIGGKYPMPRIGEGLSSLGKERLIIYSDSNRMKALIMDILPNDKFTGSMKDYTAFTYKSKGFNGSINLFELNSDAVRGYEIADGKTVSYTNLREIPDNSVTDNSKTSFRCVLIPVTVNWYQVNSITGFPSATTESILSSTTRYVLDCSMDQTTVSSGSNSSGYGGGSSWNPGGGPDIRARVGCSSFSFDKNVPVQYNTKYGTEVSGLASRLSGLTIPVGGDNSLNLAHIPDFTVLLPIFVSLPKQMGSEVVSLARGSTVHKYEKYPSATLEEVTNSFFSYLAEECGILGVAWRDGEYQAWFDRNNSYTNIPATQAVYVSGGDTIGGSMGCEK